MSFSGRPGSQSKSPAHPSQTVFHYFVGFFFPNHSAVSSSLVKIKEKKKERKERKERKVHKVSPTTRVVSTQ